MEGQEFKTTFYEDFSMAEMFGKEAIIDTYKRCLKEWSNDVRYFTAFVMALNHKLWYWYEKDIKVARLYDKLWREADSLALEIFSGEDKKYYLRTTD